MVLVSGAGIELFLGGEVLVTFKDNRLSVVVSGVTIAEFTVSYEGRIQLVNSDANHTKTADFYTFYVSALNKA